jgi:hypothetical protein
MASAKPSCTRRETSTAEPRVSRNFRMMVNMLPLPASPTGCAMGPFPSNDAIRVDFEKNVSGYAGAP